MKMGRRVRAALLVIVVAGAAGCTGSGSSPLASAAATTAPSTAITVTGAWARPSMGVADAMAVYLVIRNAGSTPDALIGAASDVASAVQMHETVTLPASPAASGGMMAMQPVSRIEVPAGTTVELKAGGSHIMLTGLRRQLVAGDSFTLTLTFEKAGPVTVTVAVRAS